VIATPGGDDIILCQITSQSGTGGYSVDLEGADFVSGGLNQSSRIRANRLFTADVGIVAYCAGHVSAGKLNEVVERVIAMVKLA
jgi:mRNA interferase MazF